MPLLVFGRLFFCSMFPPLYAARLGKVADIVADFAFQPCGAVCPYLNRAGQVGAVVAALGVVPVPPCGNGNAEQGGAFFGADKFICLHWVDSYRVVIGALCKIKQGVRQYETYCHDTLSYLFLLRIFFW